MNDNDKSSIAILRDLGRNHRKIKKFFDNSQDGRKKRRKKSQFESFEYSNREIERIKKKVVK